MYPSMPFCPLMFQGLTEQQKEFIEKQWAQQKEQFLGRQKSMYGSFTFEQTWHVASYKYYTLKKNLKNTTKEKLLIRNNWKRKRYCMWFYIHVLKMCPDRSKYIKSIMICIEYKGWNSKNAKVKAFYCFSSVYYFTSCAFARTIALKSWLALCKN